MSRLSKCVAFVGCLLVTAIGRTEDDLPSQQRLQIMEREIAQYAIAPPPGAPPHAFRFADKPLLRYRNNT